MRVTLDEIARLAGVSKATVSRVLNGKEKGVGEKTRRIVQALLDEVDYLPGVAGRKVPTTKTKTIGLIIPDVTNPFFPQLLQSVEECAITNGYTVLFGNSNHLKEREERYVVTFAAKGVDGILLATTTNRNQDSSGYADILKRNHIPCVLMDRKTDGDEYDSGIFVDNAYGTFSACDLLIKHGNRRIVFISGPKEFSTSEERLVGYKDALLHHGIQYDDALVKYGMYSAKSGYDAIAEAYMERLDFTAVLAANDMMALGAIYALTQFGYRIPEDIEVIGFDNIEFASISNPPLSTIEQPISLMGRVAVERLIELMNGTKPEVANYRLEPRIVLRGTTKREG